MGLAVIWHHCNFDFAYYLRKKVFFDLICTLKTGREVRQSIKLDIHRASALD
jgi:hypothetical protein